MESSKGFFRGSIGESFFGRLAERKLVRYDEGKKYIKFHTRTHIYIYIYRLRREMIL